MLLGFNYNVTLLNPKTFCKPAVCTVTVLYQFAAQPEASLSHCTLYLKRPCRGKLSSGALVIYKGFDCWGQDSGNYTVMVQCFTLPFYFKFNTHNL